MVQDHNRMDFLRLRKNLKKDFTGFKVIKLGILGDSSTQLLHQALRGYGYEVGLDLQIYEADYDQIEQEIFTDSSELYSFAPDYVLVFHSAQKMGAKFYQSPEQERAHFASNHLAYVQNIVKTISSKTKSKIIYFNFVEVNDFIFGNYANKIESSFLFQLRKLNYELMNLASAQKNLFINDVSSLNNEIGFSQSFDPKLYINADLVFSLDFLAAVAKNTLDIILPQLGKLKKCLILDLDNTLWGGIIGDDGMDAIQIGDLGIGKAFTRFQYWAKQLKQRGIILAVCSKNTEHIAKEPFEKHPDMVLRLDDIALFVANWDNKVENIKYIQSVLNIGFDSMVFVDDNPYERGLVKSLLPEITVPDLPEDPAGYVDFLRNLNLFETASYSLEDQERTQQYQEEAKRTVLKQSYASDEEYLKSLGMTSEVKSFDNFTIPRVAQLTQRSNQFNLRTVRYTEEDVIRISASPEYITLSFDLNDSFGNYGLISAIILKKGVDHVFVDTWIMSCRVLKRGMEEFVLNKIVQVVRQTGFSRIIGEYIPTAKNGIVKEHYKNLHFDSVDDKWVLQLDQFEQLKTHIHER